MTDLSTIQMREGMFQGLLDDGVALKRDHPISATELKQRGWTETMLNKFLKPVAHVKNPHYASASKMRIYRYSDVTEAESSEAFYKSLDKARKASNAAKAVAAIKIREAELCAEKIHIPFPENLDEIRSLATTQATGEWQMQFSETIESEILKKMLVIIVDRLKPAYWELDELYGQKGAVTARRVLDERILDLMSINCPYLIPLLQRIGISYLVISEFDGEWTNNDPVERLF